MTPETREQCGCRVVHDMDDYFHGNHVIERCPTHEAAFETAAELEEKKRELAVAYGSGTTEPEREWFSALDRTKQQNADLLAALKAITEAFPRLRYRRQPVMTPRQREIALEVDRLIMVDGVAAIIRAEGEES